MMMIMIMLLVNFATSKNLVVKKTMFPHQNIHKYIWNSPDGKTHSQTDQVHVHPMYIVCPDILSMVVEASCGIWRGFIDSDSPHYFFYLFAFKVKSLYLSS